MRSKLFEIYTGSVRAAFRLCRLRRLTTLEDQSREVGLCLLTIFGRGPHVSRSSPDKRANRRLTLCRARRLGLEKHEAAADAQGHCLGAACGAEFAENRTNVEFCGVIGNVEPRRDFFVAQPRGQHLQDFALTSG